MWQCCVRVDIVRARVCVGVSVSVSVCVCDNVVWLCNKVVRDNVVCVTACAAMLWVNVGDTLFACLLVCLCLRVTTLCDKSVCM